MSIFSLIVATVVILSAAYTSYNSVVRDELRNETLFIAKLIEESTTPEKIAETIEKTPYTGRITLIDSSGTVIYDSTGTDNPDDHSFRPEVIEAQKSGIGESARYSVTSGSKYYYCAVKLSDGTIFRFSNSSKNIFSLFYSAVILAAVMIFLIYILSSVFASRLTENIVNPISRISAGKEAENEIYEELKPLFDRLSLQNRQIERQVEKARSQKIQLNTITENMNEGLIVLDEHGDVLSVNNSALTIFESSGYDVKFRSYKTLFSGDVLEEAYLASAKGKSSSIIYDRGEKIYRVFFSPVNTEIASGGVIILLFDVTSIAQSEKLRREFSANVSHELKTPLTTIHGYSQIIASGIARQEDIKAFAQKIEKESTRMINLIGDIMRLSKLDENDSAVEKSHFSLKKAALEAVSSLEEKALQHNVTFRIDGGDSSVYANSEQITELIYDICDNAVKYNRDGGSVTVTVSDKQLSVADTGIGIPNQYLDRIFERFFRVDKSHSKLVNGTGLGLSIVKHLAQLNNVQVKVASREGEGSIFTLIFSE